METTCFLGACSTEGFVSHFDTLYRETEELTVLKGGCGCGKSTFLRAVADAARKHGMDTELVLCSSDPSSLDGVLFDGRAYVDGTAPHIFEPQICGGRMNYLNFGAFYDRAAMRAAEEPLYRLRRENAACYTRVTDALAAARGLLASPAREARALEQSLGAIAECLALSAFRSPGTEGVERRRFLCALTPRGACFGDVAHAYRRVIVLRDAYVLAPVLLRTLVQRAAEHRQSVVLGYGPMQPTGSPAHLLLPDAGVAVLSESEELAYDGPCCCRIDLVSSVPMRLRDALRFQVETVALLLRRCVEEIARAKAIHDEMETLCRPFIDFDAVTAQTERELLRIFTK